MWDSRIRLAKRTHFEEDPDFRSILPLLPNDYENEYEGAFYAGPSVLRRS